MRKLVNFRLPLFLALSLIAGIFCAFNYRMQNCFNAYLILGLFVLCVLVFLIYAIINKSIGKTSIFIAFFICVFLVGNFAINRQVTKYEDADLNYHYYTIEGRVSNICESNSGYYIIIEDADISGNISTRLDYKIALTVYGKSQDKIDLGSEIRFFALLEDRGIVYNSKTNVYGMSNDIKYSARVNVEEITLISQNPNLFESVHIYIRDSLKNGLDTEEFSVAYALMLGQDEYMESGLLDQFRNAGIAHIFAVSGLHIGFLAGLCILIFKKTKINDWISLLLTALILIFYSGICGFSSSSIRASIMCLTLMMCNNLGLKYDGLSSVSISAIIILLVSPIQLFTAGFVLSFGTVVGIITLSPLFNRIFRFLPIKLHSLLSSVISAQLVSAPLCLIFFKTTSVVAMLFNLAILPIISFIYILTFLGAVIGGVFGFSHLTLFLSNYIFKGINYIFTLTNFSIFMVGGITLSLSVLLYYLALVALSGFFNLKRLEKIIICSILILAFILATIFENLALNKQTRVYIIGEQNTAVVLVTSKEETILVVNCFSSYSSLYRIEQVLTEEKISKIDAIVVSNLYNQTDVHTIVTKIHHLADFDRVYYYGEEQPVQETAIKVSFGEEKTVKNFADNQTIPTKVAKCLFVKNGKGVAIESRSVKMLSFGEFSAQPNSAFSDEKFDCVVAYNFEQTIFYLYNAQNEISFFNNNGYQNAYTTGYLRYAFK